MQLLQQFIKKVTFALIGHGAPVPEIVLSRLQEYAQIKRLLDSLAINCVIDAGANQGQTVQLLRGLGYRGYIYSFEPQSRIYAALAQRCRQDPKWHGFQVALGETAASLQLKVNAQANEMSSLLNFHRPPEGITTETVPVIPLDAIFASLIEPIAAPRVFLKIDAEGYDLHVFRGAATAWPHIFALQAELFVHPVYKEAPHYLEALSEYEQAGFKLVNLALVSRLESGDIMCLNALMKRAA
jgi:FkbM family methyltransferase